MFFYEVTYNIALLGEFNLRQLQHILEDHHYIAGRWSREESRQDGVFGCTFETDTGIADINILAPGRDQPGHADQVLLKVPIATPPQFISSVIEFLNELAALFTFSMEAYEIRMNNGYKLGWYEVDDYEMLARDYREIHDVWQAVTGMPACKTSKVLLPQNCIHAQVREKKRPVSVILCPQDSKMNFYQLGGFPNLEVRGSRVDRETFRRKVKAIELEQCKLAGICQKVKRIPSCPQRPEGIEEVIVDVIRLEVDGVEHDLEVRNPDGPGIWIEYEMAFGTAKLTAERILQCLIELAVKLDWHIIEGLDFEKCAPLDLDAQNLIESIV